MTDPTGKIVNLTKVVDGKINRITVTDTDGDYGTSTAGPNSIMGFDKNDKVTVIGDISLFTQDEIKNTLLKNYNKADSRANDGCELADLTKANLELKEGKLSGNTSYSFALDELSNVYSAAEKELETPAADTKKTPVSSPATTLGNPAAPAASTPVTTNSVQPAGFPASYSTPSMNQSFALNSANLVKMVSNYFGATMSTSLPSGNINALAEYVWNSIPIGNVSNPFLAPQNNSAPAEEKVNNEVTNAVNNKANDAVVTEGEIKEAPKAVVTEGAIADETKEAPVEKAKAAVPKIYKNKAGQEVKKYTDKEGNRIVEIFENGKFVQKDIYNNGARVGIEMADGRVYKMNDGNCNAYIPKTNNMGQFLKQVSDKDGKRVVEVYEHNKVVERITYTYDKMGNTEYNVKTSREVFELPQKILDEMKAERLPLQDDASVAKPLIIK